MFKERLRELRKCKGYSLEELADVYNKKYNGKMNKSTLSRYENGTQEPMFGVVVNLARLFEVTADYLIGQSEYPTRAAEREATANDKYLLDSINSLEVEDKKNLISALSVIVSNYCSFANSNGDAKLGIKWFNNFLHVHLHVTLSAFGALGVDGDISKKDMMLKVIEVQKYKEDSIELINYQARKFLEQIYSSIGISFCDHDTGEILPYFGTPDIESTEDKK